MDQAARPVIIAASALLVASLVTLGVKAGSSDGSDPVNGDGPVAAGTDQDATAAPDATDEPDAAPDATDGPDTAPDATDEPDPAPDATDEPDPAPDATDGPDTAPDGSDDGSTDGSAPDTSDLDEMPDTGGGTALALGGLVAAGSAIGLRRRG